ncbi:hypothetical protein [Curtobacterium sp. MCBD17_003]|uniref:hypothetical protein n=1 Tax=Curtobacterium sp. MCBD17_003 TaxID=2175667 RepID=UPI000DA7E6E4|nr:hypothetical protein [Curtobacterium sp. MCBD17_003]WIE54236.1 hypothetical protein DEI88_014095 [Curtobacterium sp. MCBD17_003]
MTNIYVGTSEYEELAGIPQYMEQSAGLQLIGLLNLFLAQHGYRLTVNEAIRSRDRQKMLRDAYEHYLTYGSPWAALAAALYYSTHDPANGAGAADLGGPGGRALTAAEHAWLVANGPLYGVIWTGRTFSTSEWWHFNAYRSRASVLVPVGTTPTPTATPAATVKPAAAPIDGDDMKLILISTPTPDSVIKGGTYNWIWNPNPAERQGGIKNLNARQLALVEDLVKKGEVIKYGKQPASTLDGWTFLGNDGQYYPHPS